MNESKLRNIGLQFFAEPADPAPAEQNDNTPNPDNDTPEPAPDYSAEVKRLQAELAKLKTANDNLSKENAEQKRTIRASKTAEEQRAEEEKERQAAIEAELNTLRKNAFVATTAKRVLAFTGDEAAATSIAEALYGASDTDAAIDALSKVWTAKEKQLRAEFGKIPAPGAGNNEPSITKEQFEDMEYRERYEIFKNHPALYAKLTD